MRKLAIIVLGSLVSVSVMAADPTQEALLAMAANKNLLLNLSKQQDENCTVASNEEAKLSQVINELAQYTPSLNHVETILQRLTPALLMILRPISEHQVQIEQQLATLSEELNEQLNCTVSANVKKSVAKTDFGKLQETLLTIRQVLSRDKTTIVDLPNAALRQDKIFPILSTINGLISSASESQQQLLLMRHLLLQENSATLETVVMSAYQKIPRPTDTTRAAYHDFMTSLLKVNSSLTNCLGGIHSALAAYIKTVVPVINETTAIQTSILPENMTPVVRKEIHLAQERVNKNIAAIDTMMARMNSQEDRKDSTSCLSSVQQNKIYKLSEEAKELLLKSRAVIGNNQYLLSSLKSKIDFLSQKIDELRADSFDELKTESERSQYYLEYSQELSNHFSYIHTTLESNVANICAYNNAVSSDPESHYYGMLASAKESDKSAGLGESDLAQYFDEVGILSQDYNELKSYAIRTKQSDSGDEVVNIDSVRSSVVEDQKSLATVNAAFADLASNQAAVTSRIVQLKSANFSNELIQGIQSQFDQLNSDVILQKNYAKKLTDDLAELLNKVNQYAAYLKTRGADEKKLIDEILTNMSQLHQQLSLIQESYSEMNQDQSRLNYCFVQLQGKKPLFLSMQSVEGQLQLCALDEAKAVLATMKNSPEKTIFTSQINSELLAGEYRQEAAAFVQKKQYAKAMDLYDKSRKESHIALCRQKADLAMIQLSNQLGISNIQSRIDLAYDTCDIPRALELSRQLDNPTKEDKEALYQELKTAQLIASAAEYKAQKDYDNARDVLLSAYNYTENVACKTRVHQLLDELSLSSAQ